MQKGLEGSGVKQPKQTQKAQNKTPRHSLKTAKHSSDNEKLLSMRQKGMFQKSKTGQLQKKKYPTSIELTNNTGF
jgi:hypothetical protein